MLVSDKQRELNKTFYHDVRKLRYSLDSLYCSKYRKKSKSCRDLDLDRTMPNVELIQAIFIYYNIFKFHVPRLIIFLSYRAL